MNTNVYVWGEG